MFAEVENDRKCAGNDRKRTYSSSVVLLQGSIEVGDIGLVVLLVMDDHDLCRDDGLQRVEVIGQVWEDVDL